MDRAGRPVYPPEMTNLNGARFLDRTTPPHIMTLVLMAGLPAMSMSVFLPSLPEMTAYFRTEYAVMQFAVSGYLGMTAVLQVFIGPLADRYGRRPVLLASIAIFMLATLGCQLAESVEAFLFYRLVQAAIASGIVLSRAIVRDLVPQDQAASMIGYVTMGMALVPMVAPIIGGAIAEARDFKAVFTFLLVCGAGLFALCWYDQGETFHGEGRTFRDQFADYPELFGARRFWGYVAVSSFAAGAFFSFLGGAPHVASAVFELSPTATGVALGAPAIGYATGNYLSGRNATRFGINRLILAGAVICSGALAVSLLVALLGGDNAYVFFGFCSFMGLGNGLVMPNAMAGMLSVRPHLAGTASGLGGAIIIGAGAALSACAGPALELGGGSEPLLIMMTVVSTLAIPTTLYVMRRARIAAAAGRPE